VGWEDLESKFHQYFDSGVTEKGIVDLVDVRQGRSESKSHYIQRFRDVRNQCYSLTLLDAKLVGIAIQGLLPALKENIGGDYPNLAALAKKLVSLDTQYKYSRFNKSQKAANAGYNFDPVFQEVGSESESEDEANEVVAVDWAWKHAEDMPWAKSKIVDNEDDKTYSIDITKADKIFDYLLEKGHIKLTCNHKIPSAEELKKRRYCKYHNSSTHTTNDCKVFRELIQKAIEKGRIGLERKKGSSMGIEGHPFPTNMVPPSFSQGNFKVLTSERAKKARTVDSEKHISAKEYREIKAKQNQQNSRYDQFEISKVGAVRKRPTSRILLNKWQRQKEKEQIQQEREYQEWLEEEEYMNYRDEERRAREENESHWNCPFFRHCWNKGFKLPTLNNCPECSDQYWEYRQVRANH
jgi:hypothetical protein